MAHVMYESGVGGGGGSFPFLFSHKNNNNIIRIIEVKLKSQRSKDVKRASGQV